MYLVLQLFPTGRPLTPRWRALVWVTLATIALAVVAPAIGWLIPGAGHLAQKRWVRGLLLMVSIVSMYLLGLAMQGHVYKPNGGDILDMLGFVGDLGAGGLYIITRANDWGQGLISHATLPNFETAWPFVKAGRHCKTSPAQNRRLRLSTSIPKKNTRKNLSCRSPWRPRRRMRPIAPLKT